MKTQRELVQYLIQTGVLTTTRIISAFEIVDRGDFVCDFIYDEDVYGDYPLSIGSGQTISQPSTVAFMMELLQPQVGDKILDVGSGSGWTTALLAEIVGQNKGLVYGVEIIPDLVDFGTRNIAKYNFTNVQILQAGKKYGLPEYAPYNKILVSAAGNTIPEDLIAQLEIGGTMVIPVQNDIMRYVKRTQNDGDLEYFHGFSFVPLIKPML